MRPSIEKRWAQVAIPSFVLILVAVFTCDAARGAVQPTVTGQGPVVRLMQQLEPGQVVTDITRSADGDVSIEWTSRGGFCPATTNPFDTLSGVIFGHTHGQGYWTYGPWHSRMCSTFSQITWTDWGRPGHSSQSCCPWDGDRVKRKDQVGDNQYVLRIAKFLMLTTPREVHWDHPQLRVDMATNGRIHGSYSCYDCNP